MHYPPEHSVVVVCVIRLKVVVSPNVPTHELLCSFLACAIALLLMKLKTIYIAKATSNVITGSKQFELARSF